MATPAPPAPTATSATRAARDLLGAGQPRHQRVRGERGRRRAQRGARPQQELAQGAVAHAQLARHVGMGPVGHRDGDERGALASGQRLDAVQRLAQLLAALDLGLQADGRQPRRSAAAPRRRLAGC